ncbi:MAG: cytochrome c biogenesis protein CcsA [Coriobacteriia bacterium]
MRSTGVGNLFLLLGLISSVVAIASLVWGALRRDDEQGEQLTNTGYIATFASLAFVTFATGLLLAAFFGENFAFKYVAENHSTDVSRLWWLYRISGVWAGREGSLLFWEWLLSGFAAYVAYKRMSETDRLSNIALAVTNFVQVFFLVALFIEKNNPFKVTPTDWIDPATGKLLVNAAMNPLLQHWAMIFHPPTLFIGYAGMTIPFAYAMAALITGDSSKKWVEHVDRITVFVWLFLGIGIGLGAVWAYVVLGWGGYWAWDPVENASLLPWLTGVGLLHSFTVYKRRDGFKKWAIMLATVSFVLVLLGTFITRSGVVQSVHAFEQDPLSFWLFLGMMGGALLAGGIGLLLRGDTFAGADEFDSLLSKESSYYFNNVLMLVASLLTAYLTVTSALPKWLPGGGQSFGAATYDAVARPVGIFYVLIMAVCPILAWKMTEPSTFWKRAQWPLVGTAGLGALLMVVWRVVLWPNWAAEYAKLHPTGGPMPPPLADPVHGWMAVIGLLVGALAVSMSVYLFVDGALKRASAREESFGVALWNILVKARSQSGGYLTHLGIGVILIGLVGSTMFVHDIPATLPSKAGASFAAGDYTFAFADIVRQVRPNGDELNAVRYNVTRGGKPAGTIQPSQLYHAVQEQATVNVDIIYEPLRDVFVILEAVSDDGQISMNVKINPLIGFVWTGFLITIIGTALAVWPKRRALAA